MTHTAKAVCAFLLPLLCSGGAFGQAAVYEPFAQWVDRRQTILNISQALGRARAPKPESRPLILGMQSLDVELLKDAILRKHTRLLNGSRVQAGKLIIRRYSANFPQLRGIMGEALFLDANPEWGYVSKPNAPQHDVYKFEHGRQTPITGQIKVLSGGSRAYADAMIEDWRAERFFVPDDHVDSLRSYWQEQARQLQKVGDFPGYRDACRQRSRVAPAGFTLEELDTRTRHAARGCLLEGYATYTSFGAALALAAGPSAWDWVSGDAAANQALYRTTRALSILGVGVGTDFVLSVSRQGALRGTLRGNIILGTAIVVTETTWLLYEHGWSRAVTDPQFYESVAGSVAGLALGIAASGAAVAWVPGPGWVVGGAAIAAGTMAGTVGYIGGRAGVQVVYEMLAPEKLQERQRARLSELKNNIELKVSQLKQLSYR